MPGRWRTEESLQEVLTDLIDDLQIRKKVRRTGRTQQTKIYTAISQIKKL